MLGRLQVFRDAEKEPSPSKGAYVTSFLKHQEKNPIYNGRPAENFGVPVGLYHDAFNTFHTHLNRRDPPHPHASVTYENVAKLLTSFANIYGDEPSRSDTIMPLMESILGYPIDVAMWQSDDSSEGTITTSCGKFEAFLAIVEMKNEIGTGNADPYNQAGLAYRKYWADKMHEPMVPFCHFPSFLIAIAGPWIMIAGAIYLDKFIIEPLTDFIWFGGAPFHDSRREAKAIRLFSALEAGISELKSYYEGLDMRQVISKFPFITSFGEDESEMRWKYCSQLFDSKLLYEAELEDGRQVIVKFASTYNEDAHQLLANEGYAPKLHHVGKRLYGGRQIIVMDRVIGRRLGYRERVTPSQYSVLEEALRVLHSENIVHGDIRGPNIMIMEEEDGMDGEVMLIDFDECGKAGEGRYDADLNVEIGWPQGVGQESIMQLAHDIEMLNRLKPL
ncbi:hypothetical protein AGABI2DRAFT_79655 [Agaricus bisporus var. bisporus H97]|uniref:hypothetical protein n=1 Tax=Agaricus bisporus var. bisporus (strain H97 / ATCC MYA-4626 / FGSC 10389) TaxID=936046 RepID=UPI00029F6171|nr:hypothetical protein AGABI2DRAFT_79655 [Agaricus bisporus var. bisporus H97]EKV41811.1 hypothetical protein AGABI2DRAFT_79655 [Agaricus bisporus var. bisporus H97]